MQNGKGSAPRPMSITREQWGSFYERIFQRTKLSTEKPVNSCEIDKLEMVVDNSVHK